MVERQRGDAPFLILKHLIYNDPASYEELALKLGIPQSTIEWNVREILIKRHGLIKKLPNDKFAVNWYIEKEYLSKTLKRKLLRNPRPEELGCLIKQEPSVAKNMLIKYIPGYREPSEEEIISSQKALWDIIVHGSMKLPTKKELFEKNIQKLIVEGIDQETLNAIMQNRIPIDLDKSKSYLGEFPEMKPEVIWNEENDLMICTVEWSDDSRIVLDKIDSWKQKSEIIIPKKYEMGDNTGRLGGRNFVSALEIAEQLADYYVASQEILDFLLDTAQEPHEDLVVVPILKKFCRNAFETGQMDDGTKKHLVSELMLIAFEWGHSETNSTEDRDTALEIIDMLEVRNEDIVDISLDLLDEVLGSTPDDYPDKETLKGPDIHKVAEWLSRDPIAKKKLKQRLEGLIKGAKYSEQVRLYLDILKQID